LGSVTPGKVADLVLLDANPLQDITNSRRVHGVMVNGRWLSREELDGLLEQFERQ
jgi:imidazolonepropionase-like amidohydrolase